MEWYSLAERTQIVFRDHNAQTGRQNEDRAFTGTFPQLSNLEKWEFDVAPI